MYCTLTTRIEFRNVLVYINCRARVREDHSQVAQKLQANASGMHVCPADPSVGPLSREARWWAQALSQVVPSDARCQPWWSLEVWMGLVQAVGFRVCMGTSFLECDIDKSLSQ